MSFMNDFYTWLNAQIWIPDNIAFDVHPDNPADPYFCMTPVQDAGTGGVLCANDSGQTVIEFNGYGTDKKLLFDAMDTLRKNILQARNALVNYELWYIKASGVVGYATEDVRIYRYSFDIETQWRDK
jgi:hypothetical protein